MKKIFRILTIIQIGYYAYDMIKNRKSFKEEFVPNVKKAARRML